LRTTHTFTVYAVGRVATDGQQDFHAEPVTHLADHTAAVAAARRLVRPGCRILLRDLDTETWSVIPGS
jgi:hypothetical protein